MTRKQGKPHKGQKPIGPLELEIIRSGFLRRRPYAWIAKELGVSHTTVANYVKSKILPEFQERADETLSEELARIELVEREAWAGFDRSKQMAETRIVERTAPVEPHPQEPVPLLPPKVEKLLRDKHVPIQQVKRIRRRVFRDGDKGWLELVAWCIAERCRIFGRYHKDKDPNAAMPHGPPSLNFVLVENRDEAIKAERFRDFESRMNGSNN